MPVYVYRREDGSTFEFAQRMSADALVSCPTTGRAVERVLQPFAPRFKGTGFYATDHRKQRGDATTSVEHQADTAVGPKTTRRRARARSARPVRKPVTEPLVWLSVG